MALGDISITAVGNLTDVPELRFTPTGTAVCAFTVAVNPKTYNGESGKWEDAGAASFLRVQCWKDLAENVAGSLAKGDRVIVSGRIRQEKWEDKATSEKRSDWKMTADSVGPDLAFATAKVSKTVRANGTGPDDPWTTASRTRPTSAPANAADAPF
jgi:single-strand DNA-binding protein